MNKEFEKKEEAYKGIKELVEKFEYNYKQFHSSNYNETLTRQDFINPFFEALGWDISNKAGDSQTYRHVVLEDEVKIDGHSKHVDYSFSLSGNRVFLVEAKKPAVALKDSKEAAYQIRRYAWNRKLSISILTDFEEFAIYDCTKKPSPNDEASNSRIKYINYREYLDKDTFDFIYDTFAFENVKRGSLEKYSADTKSKRGSESVDDDFLNTLDKLRVKLASNINKLNNLPERDLNFAVQHIINRIIFLRMAEDRGVENYGDLMKACSKDNENYYKNIVKIFKRADGRYNSGIFDFNKDKITQKIEVDNKVIKEIINDLYYPKSPYLFSLIPIEIIGHAYEQFLGNIITIGKNNKVEVELKQEVRKAGGVYYTPEYIVDYIVENTVGEKIKGKTPDEIAKIKIVDPACGSGSFLLGAYKCLLNYHREYYEKHGNKKYKNSKEDVINENGELKLWVRKQILINNIFGVDIDSNAVEVAKLSLLLKCMEEQTPASIVENQSLFNERALPSLDDNIKCGNSLIGSDFYHSQDTLNIDAETQYKINCFDWEREFVDIFNSGGFDIVIGNPPYVMIQNLNTKEYFEYCLNTYKSAKYKIDTYQIFIEKGLNLLKLGGLISFITPNTFLTNIHSEPLRDYILNNSYIININLYKFNVFKDASVNNCVFNLLNNNYNNNENNINVKVFDNPIKISYEAQIKQSQFLSNERHNFNIMVNEFDNNILEKINKKSKPLGLYCGAYFGIQTFDRKKYVSNIKINKDYKPIIDGGNILPFYLKEANEYVHFLQKNIKSGGNPIIYEQDRIVVRQIGQTPIACFISAGIYSLNTVYNIYSNKENDLNLYFILGIINSKTTKYFWIKKNSDEKKIFPIIKKEAILSIPIPIIDLSKKSDKEIHDKLVNLVDSIMGLNKKLATENNPNVKTMLERQVRAIDGEIDRLVYGLYGLSEEEIRIIEGK